MWDEVDNWDIDAWKASMQEELTRKKLEHEQGSKGKALQASANRPPAAMNPAAISRRRRMLHKAQSMRNLDTGSTKLGNSPDQILRKPPARTSSGQSPRTNSKRQLLGIQDEVEETMEQKEKAERAERRRRRMIRKAQSARNFDTKSTQDLEAKSASDELRKFRSNIPLRSCSEVEPTTNSSRDLFGSDEPAASTEEGKGTVDGKSKPKRSRSFGRRFRRRAVSASPDRRDTKLDLTGSSNDCAEQEKENPGDKGRSGRKGILQRLKPRRTFRSQSPRPSKDEIVKTPKKGFFRQQKRVPSQGERPPQQPPRKKSDETMKNIPETSVEHKPKLPPSISSRSPKTEETARKSAEKISEKKRGPQQDTSPAQIPASIDPVSPVRPSSGRRSSWGVLTISPISKPGKVASRPQSDSFLSATREESLELPAEPSNTVEDNRESLLEDSSANHRQNERVLDSAPPMTTELARLSSWGLSTISPVSKKDSLDSRQLSEDMLPMIEEPMSSPTASNNDNVKRATPTGALEEAGMTEGEAAPVPVSKLARESSWGTTTMSPVSRKKTVTMLTLEPTAEESGPATPTSKTVDISSSTNGMPPKPIGSAASSNTNHSNDAATPATELSRESSWGMTTMSPFSKKKALRVASFTTTQEETVPPSPRGSETNLANVNDETAPLPDSLARKSSWGMTTLSPVSRKKSLQTLPLSPTNEEVGPATPGGDSTKSTKLERDESWGLTSLVMSPSPDKSSKGTVTRPPISSSKKSNDPMAFGHASASCLLASPMLMSNKKRRQPRFGPVSRNKSNDDPVKARDYRKMQLLVNNRLMAKSGSMSNLMASPLSTPTLTSKKGHTAGAPPSPSVQSRTTTSPRRVRQSSLDLVSSSKPLSSNTGGAEKSAIPPPPPSLPYMSNPSPPAKNWSSTQRKNKSSLLDDSDH